MSDDNYGAALLALGMREQITGSYYTLLSCQLDGTIRLDAGASKTTRAIAYLRERKLYCLDQKQARIPPKERPQTVLDKWMKERHK